MEKSEVAFQGQESKQADVPDCEAIDLIMYLADYTKQDIAFVVGTHAQLCETPTLANWWIVILEFCHLYGTEAVGKVDSQNF